MGCAFRSSNVVPCLAIFCRYTDRHTGAIIVLDVAFFVCGGGGCRP